MSPKVLCIGRSLTHSLTHSYTNLTHLKGLPALVVQFGHLLLDPRGNVGDGHVDDILQEDSKVLQGEQGT